jgi:hypothetical protein
MPYATVGKENAANIDIYYKDWPMTDEATAGPPRRATATQADTINADLLAFIKA